MPEPDDVVPDVLAGTVWAPHLPRTALPAIAPPTPERADAEPAVGEPAVLEPAVPPTDPGDEPAAPPAEDLAGTTEDESADDASRTATSRSRRSVALLVALAVIVVALAVTSTVLLRAVRRHDAESDRRVAAVTAARQVAVNFTTIDYRTLDRDLARVADGATGDFRREFTEQATSKEFTDRVRTTKVVSTGEVLDAAVTDLSAGRAVVLVIADSTVTNSSLPAPGAVRHVRLRLTMTLVRDRWLVSDLAPAA